MDLPESGKILLMEFGILGCGVQVKESEIPLTIGIHNPSSTDKYWNPVPGIRNPQHGIQNLRLSWIAFNTWGDGLIRESFKVN